ncbi:MarR family winged helix-turn-helix transcriptional regulator [Streptomyces sp. NPDC047014]|uniref:MarR family winged helix-turn-helix transcriptional regulator n=1 Tax=Streptomyces sp. NPDC047014 TaxID=3155736 RepID=UPI0033F74082
MERPTRPTADQAPADPTAPDDLLASQPVGYWTGLAHAAVTRQLRDAMARIDVTQPQYWVLNRVNGSNGGNGSYASPSAPPTREEVAAELTPLADGPHEIGRVVDQLLHRGWLSADDTGRLGLTGPGEAARLRLRALVTEMRAVVHQGISDEEYASTLKVLRRMIANVEAAPGAPHGPFAGAPS